MPPPSPKQAIIRIVCLWGLKKPLTSGLLFLFTFPSTSVHTSPPPAESERFLRDCLHSTPQSPFCRWRKENLPYPQPPLSQVVSAKQGKSTWKARVLGPPHQHKESDFRTQSEESEREMSDGSAQGEACCAVVRSGQGWRDGLDSGGSLSRSWRNRAKGPAALSSGPALLLAS